MDILICPCRRCHVISEIVTSTNLTLKWDGRVKLKLGDQNIDFLKLEDQILYFVKY
jgi:hypothetical protein